MPVHEVRTFLLTFKKTVTAGSGVHIVPRENTKATLTELGLTKANLEEILLSLSIRDYCKGPEAERDRVGRSAGEIWFFGKRIQEREVYIKLKLFQVDEQMQAKCISFHFAESSLHYPHRM